MGDMKDLVTIRLEPETRRVLTAEARRLGVPFRTLLRTIAEERAVATRSHQIREQGRALVKRLKRSKLGREFFEDWGTPAADIGAK